ncbi:MAG: ketoacyl-ACP synthase III [Phycisphaerales bacterium]|nr:ketoacyl-ACP synthase III [Phycisphaerales bacterium]
MSSILPTILRGTGSYVPREVLDNAFFERYLDTSDEWILTRTGVRERRRIAPGESTSTMAARAAERALLDAGMQGSELDLIILCTATPDQPIPATACNVQAHLGLSGVPAFDLGAACSGFMYGTTVAANLVQAGLYRNILVIGAETLTQVTDYEDRTTCVLFGDAAGAAILARSEDPRQGLLYASLGADGTRIQDIWAPAGGSALPASANTVAERLHFLRMRGREVYKFAVVKMMDLIDGALKATGLSSEQLKMVIPHQSNLRIIESVREKLNLPVEKIAINIDRYGNTSAASIIVALDEARKQGQVRKGDLIMMLGLGAGLTWGVSIWRL